LRWRWAPVVRMAAVPKEARRGQSVRKVSDLRLKSRSRPHSGLAQSRQMQVVPPRVPKAGKVPSQAPGKPSISSAISANTASIRPRSCSAILADQEQNGWGRRWTRVAFCFGPLDGKRIADGRRMRRAPASRSQASRARLEAGLDFPDRRAGSESWRPDKL
jgi:hypothetical protein